MEVCAVYCTDSDHGGVRIHTYYRTISVRIHILKTVIALLNQLDITSFGLEIRR